MTCEETTAGQTIDRLLSEHPDLDPPSDGALYNLDQFHIDSPDATGLLIGSLGAGPCGTVPAWLQKSEAEALNALHEPILDAVRSGDTAMGVRAVLRHHEVMAQHLADRR
jgi:hypothetical protein